MNNFDAALNYLDYLCTFGIKAGLERITQLAAALNNLQIYLPLTRHLPQKNFVA